MEYESNCKPIPNICPWCGFPLTGSAHCTNPGCPHAWTCEYCGKRLNVYGVCTTWMCLSSRCDICDVTLNPNGVCPNDTCPNSMKSVSCDWTDIPPDHSPFTRDTIIPEGEQVVTCDRCGKRFSTVLEACPYCTPHEAHNADDLPDEDPTEENDIHHSFTIPCPDPVKFDAESTPPSERKSQLISKPSAPVIHISIEDAGEDEAELFDLEMQKLLNEESA